MMLPHFILETWSFIFLEINFALHCTKSLLVTSETTELGKAAMVPQVHFQNLTCLSAIYQSNGILVTITLCVQQLHHSVIKVFSLCFSFFLLPAHNHPTRVFVPQGAGRAAYNSGADVSGE